MPDDNDHLIWKYFLCLKDCPLYHSGVFELNFMASQPASGYYQFSVAIAGDSRFVANHVEVLNLIFEMCSENQKFSYLYVFILCVVPCHDLNELTSAFNS